MEKHTDVDNIIHDILTNTNSKEFYQIKYNEFSKNCPYLFNKLFEPDLDKQTLNYMLKQREKMKLNKQTEYDSSVKVGTMLVDKYVKPNLS